MIKAVIPCFLPKKHIEEKSKIRWYYDSLPKLPGNAFTLAEVLITLAVIGVIAAISIPSLIANTEKQEFVTGLKKAYSTFSGALVKIAADYGCPGDLKCTDIFKDYGTIGVNDAQDQAGAGSIIAQYFNVAKNCGVAAGCFSPNVTLKFDGTGARDSNTLLSTSGYKFTTADGMHFYIYHYQKCNDYGFSSGVTNHMKQICGVVLVDTNGDKGPNNYGRDIFKLLITNGKGPSLYPENADDDGVNGTWNASDPTLCSATNNDGRACAARIMEEGWQMNY